MKKKNLVKLQPFSEDRFKTDLIALVFGSLLVAVIFLCSEILLGNWDYNPGENRGTFSILFCISVLPLPYIFTLLTSSAPLKKKKLREVFIISVLLFAIFSLASSLSMFMELDGPHQIFLSYFIAIVRMSFPLLFILFLLISIPLKDKILMKTNKIFQYKTY